MPGQWEQRQFLVRCPNNSSPRLHIYLPVSKKKKKRGEKKNNTAGTKSRDEHGSRRATVFSHAWRAGMCSCVWFLPPPHTHTSPPPPRCSPRFPHSLSATNLPLKAPAVKPAGPWRCRPSVCIVECVCEGSKCTGDDMLFVGKGASPLTPFFSFIFLFLTTTDRECLRLQWNLCFPPELVCVCACVCACVCVQGGGATLPSQLLMIMSGEIMSSHASVQWTPVVHQPFMDVVECSGTHHRRRISFALMFKKINKNLNLVRK